MNERREHPGPPPWEEVVAKFPAYLERLLASEIYGRSNGRPAAPKEHGVYLFSEGSAHLYVGRCGRTERAVKVGKGHSNFRSRLAAHSRPSSGHNSATLAWRLTFAALGAQVDAMPTTRTDLELHPPFRAEFVLQKERVTAMDFRIVPIEDDFESYVFEAYAAGKLRTAYNSWATS
jgi:hypothetical protein